MISEHTNISSGSKVYLGIKRETSPEFEGIRVLIRNGSVVYTFNSGYREVERDLGGYIPVTERHGESSTVLKNGKYYLSWHISAALGNNGLGESWIENNSGNPEMIIETLKELKRVYTEDSFAHCVDLANQIAGTDVY